MTQVKEHTKTINGKKVNVKSYHRKEPVLSASEFNKKNNIKVPFGNRAGEMSVQFSMNVPSTLHDKEIPPKEFDRRVNETEEFLSKTFGGDTSIKANGGYVENGMLINEGVVRVESSMSKAKYQENKDKLQKFIKAKQKQWKQDSIGFNFEDEFYMYPKRKWMRENNVIDN